jgi:hypothetical protein
VATWRLLKGSNIMTGARTIKLKTMCATVMKRGKANPAHQMMLIEVSPCRQ